VKTDAKQSSGFFLDVFFDPEVGDNMFLQNID
jgi:hypothetical protein